MVRFLSLHVWLPQQTAVQFSFPINELPPVYQSIEKLYDIIHLLHRRSEVLWGAGGYPVVGIALKVRKATTTDPASFRLRDEGAKGGLKHTFPAISINESAVQKPRSWGRHFGSCGFRCAVRITRGSVALVFVLLPPHPTPGHLSDNNLSIEPNYRAGPGGDRSIDACLITHKPLRWSQTLLPPDTELGCGDMEAKNIPRFTTTSISPATEIR